MLILVSICFMVAVLAPILLRVFKYSAGMVLALAPLALFIRLLYFLPVVASGSPVVEQIPLQTAFPGMEIIFRLDGLSMLFALMISGIGTLIVLYTQGYLKDDPLLGRFYLYLMGFMASMLGVVLSDNLILTFIFWELTSFTSYLLIAFNHESEGARAAALQAMLLTVAGGFCLLCGMVLLADAGGSWRISELLGQREVLTAHMYYPWILGLIALGAFTKSAQVPFHFWIPNAMQAPTPASAFLHSSTMVKAGIFLLARLHPALGGTEGWTVLLTTVGTLTFLTGAFMALGQQVLKRLLAYTTVSALGAMVMLLGIGTTYTLSAVMVFIVAHALYKATLFMVVGNITHETGGETSVDKLGGLRKCMPVTFVCALLAGLSMSGAPPFWGFVAKESWLHAVGDYTWLIVATVVGGAAYVLVASRIGITPFLGKSPTWIHVHEAPPFMLFGPALLALCGVVFPFFCGQISHVLIEPAAQTVALKPLHVHLHLWAGFNRYVYISIGTLLLGVVFFKLTPFWKEMGARLLPLRVYGPAAVYQKLLDGVLRFAAWKTRHLQTGLLRDYIRWTVVFAVGLIGIAFFRGGGFHRWDHLLPISPRIVLVAAVMVSATFVTACSRSRIRSILSLGIVGYSMAMLFTFFGAPDLAMTQLVIETLTVILFALAFYHLPPILHTSKKRTQIVDVTIATGVGGAMMLLVLAALHVYTPTAVSDYYLEHSYKEAHGRNVVNVILVDFRALDTLGEITVLALAALGAFALLKFRPVKQKGDV